MHDHDLYPPLNTLKSIVDDIWIVDGPLIRFGFGPFKMPFPTRMTVVRVGDDLFVHSPTPLTPDLKAQIDAVGRVRWLIGPNRLHFWWLPDWRAAYPEAGVWIAPEIRKQAKGRIDFPTHLLEARDGYPWDGALRTLPIVSRFMTEAIFLHASSRTLILTDLIENFEPDHVRSWGMRLLVRLGAADGFMPRDMRATFGPYKPALRRAIETLIGWNPERILLAHGRWYECDGTVELRRAFNWLLG
jgi:hypothetical protein